MKKTFSLMTLIVSLVGFLFPLAGVQPAAASGSLTVWVGGGSSVLRRVNGPPNTQVTYDIVESNPGLIQYSLTQNGSYSNSLTLTVNLDSSGNGSVSYYTKNVQAGETTETICSPQLGCDSPTNYTVLTPASGVDKIQYLKDGSYVDVPDPLKVLKGDTVDFKAIPSPAGSVFMYFPNGPIDPSWSGSSGATGIADTTQVTFDTASSNNHDYKTVIASVQNGGSFTANVLVVNGVQSVTIDKIDPATIFNDNPNTGGGKRVFPDKNDPSDTVNRKRVRVSALTSLGSNKTIYFKSFDLDDPSTDAAPVDPNGSAGNDNRGGQGTAAQFGILSAVGGNGTTNSASARTDGNGLASVDLTVTMQPGDNFMVAASDDSTYLNGLTVTGILLQDSGGNIVGSETPKAEASPMLTVWRRLNVEVDSMGIVPSSGPQQNHIAGRITSVNGTSATATLVFTDQNLNDGSPKLDDPPPGTGNGRFEKGIVRIGTTGNVTATADLQGNGTNYVQKNDGNGIVIPCRVTKSQETDVTGNVISLVNNVVTIAITAGTLTTNFVGGTITIGGVTMNVTAVDDAHNSVTIDALGNIPFNLVDDDDFNSNNTGNLQGDEGEDIEPIQPLNIFDTTFRLMQNSDAAASNVFAPAYIRPSYDWASTAGYDNASVPVNLNVTDTSTAIDQQLGLGQNSSGDESSSFWVVYIQLGYQEEPSEDNDPDGEPGGATTGTGGSWNGGIDIYSGSGSIPRGTDGSLIYIEVQRDVELNNGIVRLIRSVPHEVGHQFALLGDDAGNNYGIMSYGNGLQFVPEHINILRWRVSSPGKP